MTVSPLAYGARLEDLVAAIEVLAEFVTPAGLACPAPAPDLLRGAAVTFYQPDEAQFRALCGLAGAVWGQA